MTVFDNRGACSHAAFCTNDLPQVWRSGVSPWIDPDGAAAENVVQVIKTCPSGALSYGRGGAPETVYHETPEVAISRDGAYAVRGGIDLADTTFAEGTSREHGATSSRRAGSLYVLLWQSYAFP